MEKLSCVSTICLIAIITLSSLATVRRVAAQSLTERDYDIITTDDIVRHSSELQAFIDLKRSEGYTVRLVTQSYDPVTGKGYGGLSGQYPNGRADQIREWLIENTPPETWRAPYARPYVLLIGDPTPWDPLSEQVDTAELGSPGQIERNHEYLDSAIAEGGDTWVPMKTFWLKYVRPSTYPAVINGGFYIRNVPTDLYYSDLSDNFDFDHDGLCGETNSIGELGLPPSPLDVNAPYAVIFQGTLTVKQSATYYFRLFATGHVALYIDDKELWDEDGGPFPTMHPVAWSQSVPYGALGFGLTAGVPHKIVIDWQVQEYSNPLPQDGILQFYWCGPSNGYNWDTVPDSNSFNPDGTLSPNGTLDLVGYYHADNFDGRWLAEEEYRTLDFTWSRGDWPSNGMPLTTDAYVGRIPTNWNSYALIDKVLLKTINYETDQGDISWRKSILLPDYPIGPNDYSGWNLMNAIAVAADHTPIPAWQRRVFSDCNDTPAGKAPTVEENRPIDQTDSDAISETLWDWKNLGGFGVVTWFTHGSPREALHVFDESSCGYLDDSKPSFVFAAACENANPDDKWNLAHMLLWNGAICVVGATRFAYARIGWDARHLGYLCALADEDIAYEYTVRLLAGNSAGDSLEFARGTCTRNVPDQHAWLNLLDFNLYGDPDCSLYNVHHLPSALLTVPGLSNSAKILPFHLYSSKQPQNPMWQNLTFQLPASLFGNCTSGNCTFPPPNINALDLNSTTLNGVIPVDPSWLIFGNGTDGMVILTVRVNYTLLEGFLLSRDPIGGNTTLTLMGSLLNGTEFREDISVSYRNSGDVNLDGKVNLKDVFAVGLSFGSAGPGYLYKGSTPNPRWNPLADENGDNKIDLRDCFQVCLNFGTTIPQTLYTVN